jgi:CheY-like chemotaxis protein
MTAMSKRRILVVDDEEGLTRSLKVTLEATGRYDVRMVNRASQALTSARDFEPDLVLLDVLMPEMDGGDVAAQFKNDARLKDVPVVFLTAIVTKRETGGREIISGQQHLLAKPAGLRDLTQCIQDHLSPKSLKRSEARRQVEVSQ